MHCSAHSHTGSRKTRKYASTDRQDRQDRQTRQRRSRSKKKPPRAEPTLTDRFTMNTGRLDISLSLSISLLSLCKNSASKMQKKPHGGQKKDKKRSIYVPKSGSYFAFFCCFFFLLFFDLQTLSPRRKWDYNAVFITSWTTSCGHIKISTK